MNAASLPAEFEHHAELDDLEERLSQVDVHLERGIRTLIAIAKMTREGKLSTTSSAIAPRIPSSISETEGVEGEHYPLCHALVCATMHKIWRHRRRYKYLPDDLKDLIDWLPHPFMGVTVDSSKPLDFVNSLDRGAFGALNPLTASQVFRVVLQKGEEETLSPIGILALFSVVWALSRRHGETAIAGAALDPWRPTAVITAKCVFGLEALRENCLRRATLLKDIRKTSKELRLGAPPLTVDARWRFCLAADRLALQLHEFGDLSDDPNRCPDAARSISSTVGRLGSASAEDEYTAASATIARELDSVLQDARTKLLKALKSTRPVIETLLPLIENFLDPSMDVDTRRQFMKYCHQFREGAHDEYWKEIHNAAMLASDFCRKLVGRLNDALDEKFDTDALLTEASAAYTDIANRLLDLRRPTIRWCESVVREQIAHASASNDTDFDPAELVSAIAVSRLSNSFSQLEISDAIEKAKRGSRADGSWARGQPIYLKERVLGVWPSTPDIVWMLCTSLNRSPKLLRIADDVLMRFLHWTERTLNVVKFKDEKLQGWSSELYRNDRTIDVWTTGAIVNSLIEIRQMLELRVSQLCEKRFKVIRPTKNLNGVDPIDLGATHQKRLHRALLDVARETREKTDDARYALVLHGPPGSSKTELAKALAKEMWEQPREGERILIRITPADFTRLGGERLDSEARFIFRLLSLARRVTILFDEIDDLLRRRTAKTPPTFFNLVVPAMLNRLQDLRDAAPSQEICFLLATNYIDRIEPALIRRGRMDAEFPVVYPDAFSRDAIFEKELKGAIPGGPMQKLIERTVGLPFLDIRNAARDVIPTADPDKILADRAPGTIQSDQDSLVVQYAEKHRWKRVSKPLLMEFFHVITSQERDQDKNRRMLTMLDEAVNPKAALGKWQEQFDTFCKERGLTLPTTKP